MKGWGWFGSEGEETREEKKSFVRIRDYWDNQIIAKSFQQVGNKCDGDPRLFWVVTVVSLAWRVCVVYAVAVIPGREFAGPCFEDRRW